MAAAFIAVGIWIGDELLKAKRAEPGQADFKARDNDKASACCL